MADKIPVYGELDCRTAENIIADAEQIRYDTTKNVKEKIEELVTGGGDGGVDALEAKLNENIIKNPGKTYLVWKGNSFPNNNYATFKAPAGCTIDWGDGNVETFDAASTAVNTHTYTDGFEYHLISLSKYTVVDSASFGGCSGLTSVTIGNSVTSISDNADRKSVV